MIVEMARYLERGLHLKAIDQVYSMCKRIDEILY